MMKLYGYALSIWKFENWFFSLAIIYAGKREIGMVCEEIQDNEIGSVNLNSERIFVLFNYAI